MNNSRVGRTPYKQANKKHLLKFFVDFINFEMMCTIYIFTVLENDGKQQYKGSSYRINGRGSYGRRGQLEHALSQRTSKGKWRQTVHQVSKTLTVTYSLHIRYF